METQVKGARPKQKNHAQGQRTFLGRDKRKFSSCSNDDEPARRSFVSSAPTKRAVARFAKGPSETGGFAYPRRRLVANAVTPVATPLDITSENESLIGVGITSENESPIGVGSASMVESSELATNELEIVKQIVDDNLLVLSPEESSTESFLEVDSEPCKSISSEPTATSDNEKIIDASSDVIPKEDQRIEACPEVAVISSKALEDCVCHVDLKPIADHEALDDTIGPGSSESESSSDEDNDVEVIKPIPVVIPMKPLKPKVVSPPITRKIAPVSNVSRKVTPSAPPVARSSWSKFLPLVIEIKATVPYPMHLLGFALLLGICFLLRLLYQFGAGLGEGMDLQGQLLMLAKLVFLFVAIVVCVNFVEDNKELQHTEPASPAQPRLRPSKITKNKKKLMMKV